MDKIKLKVVESVSYNINKGIARIPLSVMKKIKVRPDDIINLKGKRKTIAIVGKVYPEDKGLNIIRIDRLTRKNAEANIGEMITVKKAEAKPAKKVVIAPTKGVIVRAPLKVFKHDLLGRAVLKGDLISTSRWDIRTVPLFKDVFDILTENIDYFGLFDVDDVKFIVSSTIPKGAVIIIDKTEVIVKERTGEGYKSKAQKFIIDKMQDYIETIKKAASLKDLRRLKKEVSNVKVVVSKPVIKELERQRKKIISKIEKKIKRLAKKNEKPKK